MPVESRKDEKINATIHSFASQDRTSTVRRSLSPPRGIRERPLSIGLLRMGANPKIPRPHDYIVAVVCVVPSRKPYLNPALGWSRRSTGRYQYVGARGGFRLPITYVSSSRSFNPAISITVARLGIAYGEHADAFSESLVKCFKLGYCI